MGSLSAVHAIAQSLPYHGPSVSCVKDELPMAQWFI